MFCIFETVDNLNTDKNARDEFQIIKLCFWSQEINKFNVFISHAAYIEK